jgi:hypothetical protein
MLTARGLGPPLHFRCPAGIRKVLRFAQDDTYGYLVTTLLAVALVLQNRLPARPKPHSGLQSSNPT